MKKLVFLNKLKKQGKIGLVEPSEEMKKSYIQKSESNLISSKILLENKKLEESVGLAYYSMYHLLTALLCKAGIKSENHSASIILLKDIFDQDNTDVIYAKTERLDKQYYVDFSITHEDVQDTIRKAEIFNSKIFDFLSKLSAESIENYRKRFLDLTG